MAYPDRGRLPLLHDTTGRTIESEQMNRDDEFLRTQYTELRQEIRDIKSSIQTRISRAIASIAVISAYTFHTEQYILFTVVPFLVGFLIILHIEEFTWMIRLARQICIIQEIVDVKQFNWEKRYGMFGTNHEWSNIYSGSASALVGVGYFLSIMISIGVAQESTYSEIPIIPLSVSDLVILLNLLLVFVVAGSAVQVVVVWKYNSDWGQSCINDDECPRCESELNVVIEENKKQISCGDSECDWTFPSGRQLDSSNYPTVLKLPLSLLE